MQCLLDVEHLDSLVFFYDDNSLLAFKNANLHSFRTGEKTKKHLIIQSLGLLDVIVEKCL